MSLLCLMGPTASGKTDLAIRLAEKYPLTLISVDSALVYRGMDIGTGKPEYPHALMNCRDPAHPYSVAEFCKDAKVAINQAKAEGKIPCLVGGTMMYYRALLMGLAELPSANPALRATLLEAGNAKGWPAMHAQLAALDPDSGARIHPHDAQRIQRALEVWELTGKSLSAHWGEERPLEATCLALWPENRGELHQVIEKRFDHMLAQGLLEEVAALYVRPDLHAELPSIRSVGYRQVWDYLSGMHDAKTMREKAIIATRQLAKRQLTWLRGWPGLIQVPYQHDDPFSVVEKYVVQHGCAEQ